MDQINGAIAQLRLLLLAKGYNESVLYAEGEPRKFLSTLATQIRDLVSKDEDFEKSSTIYHYMKPRFTNVDSPVTLQFALTYDKTANVIYIHRSAVQGVGREWSYSVDQKNPNQLPAAQTVHSDVQQRLSNMASKKVVVTEKHRKTLKIGKMK